jgi:hypothetical protein
LEKGVPYKNDRFYVLFDLVALPGLFLVLISSFGAQKE